MAANNNITISGYAALWNVSYSMGSYDEIIAPGALDGVDFSECRLLYNHDANLLLATVKSKTLTVQADSKGLFYRAKLPDTATGREVATLVERGDLRQSSWGFVIAQSGKQWNRDGTVLTISRVKKLFDVSLVTYPANPATSVFLESIPLHKERAAEIITEATATTTTSVDNQALAMALEEVKYLRRTLKYAKSQYNIQEI